MRTLHVGLRVEDLGRSLGFYTSLGYEVVGRVPETQFGSLTMLKLPYDDFVSVELVHDPNAGPVQPGGLNHLVIKVEDLHGTVARLAALEPPDGSTVVDIKPGRGMAARLGRMFRGGKR